MHAKGKSPEKRLAKAMALFVAVPLALGAVTAQAQVKTTSSFRDNKNTSGIRDKRTSGIRDPRTSKD